MNEDPRPLADGDFAVVALESLSAIEGPAVKQEETTLEVGGADTLEDFSAQPEGHEPGRGKGVRGSLSG